MPSRRWSELKALRAKRDRQAAGAAGPTQLTRPEGTDRRTGEPAEPMEIPVPLKRDVMRDLAKGAQSSEKPKKSGSG
jgi:hypothetical protein